jgi:hypothetical protein
MVDFTDVIKVQELLKKAQEADHDNREKVREVTHFIEKDDGQWEPGIVSRMAGRPRYTFDMCNPVIDSIAGEMEQANFAIKVRPAGGEASEDVAEVMSGMIRNIENMSNAVNMVYNPAGRQMITSGFDAWRVVQDWSDSESFEQDLFIRKIHNAVDRVWLDIGSEMQDASDARWGIILQTIPTEEYEERFEDKSLTSVGDDRTSQVYSYKPEVVIVGEILYLKKRKKELVLMSNGAVYEDNEEFQQVKDDLEAKGVTETKRRVKEVDVCFSRLFNGSEWLTDEKETVFNTIPVIPDYGNYKVSENKIIYRGAVNKLMDAQRVYNYAQSRAIEEGALAPRGKYWMTREQAKSDIATLQTLNTNADPVQTYTHIDGQAPPFFQGGAQVNQGLQATAGDMKQNIMQSSAIFSANLGDSPGLQSGVALEQLQNKGDNSTIKYFKSQEIAICRTAQILVDAIPKVYDTKRTVRVLGEDGVIEDKVINDQVFDQETQELVRLNDLRKGKYDVVCDVGQAFKNRQQEAADTLMKVAAIDPSVLQMGKDVFLNSITAPGIDLIAKRARIQLLLAGQIPGSQQTDEEKQKLAQIQQMQAQQQQQPDPIQQAFLEQTQAQTADVISKADERQKKAMLEAEKLRQSDMRLVMDAQKANDEAALKFQQAMLDQQKAANEQQKQIVEALNTQAQTLKVLREAMGIDAIVGPHNTEAYIQQSEIITDQQDAINPTTETNRITNRLES